MASFARAYHRALTRRPILVQSLTAGSLFVLGDAIAQHGIEKRPLSQHDYKRTVMLASYGTCVIGPAVALWYRFLGRVVTIKSKTGATLCRTALDQLVFAPTSLAVFFIYVGTVEMKTKEEIQYKLDKDYFNTLKANWMVWTPAQLCNFYLTPVNYQSLVGNTVALGWNSYLAYVACSKANDVAPV